VKNLIQERQIDTATRAKEVMAFAVEPQFNDGKYIEDDEARRTAIFEAAVKSPLFEGAPEPFVRMVSNAWATSIGEYATKYDVYPNAEELANSHRAAQRFMMESAKTQHSGFAGPMFEAASGDMQKSDGIMRQALFVAMMLPVALGAATGDACTFVPCERDESDIYRITQVAASTFGSYKPGDELDMQSAGVYSQFQRTGLFPATYADVKTPGVTANAGDKNVPDGSLTFFGIKVSGLESAFGLSKDLPIRPGRTMLLINRMPARSYDDGLGNIYWNGKDAKGNAFKVAGTIWPTEGVVEVKFDTAPPAGTELALTFELDVENKPEIIPLINQKMVKFTVKPSQYALATEYSVQALMDAQREFGLDLSSQLFNGARNWLSHETDMKRLREMLWRAVYTANIKTGWKSGDQVDAFASRLRVQFNKLSNDMVQRTKTTGVRGGFAGATVVNMLRSLPSSMWTPAPGYAESPYVQFAGTLFGSIRIYEVPNKVCAQFVNEGLPLDDSSCLFYGRGENIGDAGLVAGDAVAAIPFVHPTTPQLVNRVTLWGSAVNVVHPDHGEDYFTLAKFSETDLDGVITVHSNP